MLIKLITISTLLFLSKAFAEEEKTLVIHAHVEKMIMTPNKTYRLGLAEFAAVYTAPEKFSECLQNSIQQKKAVSLKITAYSLNVLDCK